MSKVVLMSSDSKRFDVDEAVARKSQLLKNMIEDTGTEEVIYLPNVKENSLKRILQYCEHYINSEPKEIEKPLPKASLTDLVDPWDQEFINSIKDQDEILELILASNYLDIKSLLQLGCAKIATLIKGKSAEEIRKTFGIVNDFTPEEEAQIREENNWAQESTI